MQKPIASRLYQLDGAPLAAVRNRFGISECRAPEPECLLFGQVDRDVLVLVIDGNERNTLFQCRLSD